MIELIPFEAKHILHLEPAHDLESFDELRKSTGYPERLRSAGPAFTAIDSWTREALGCAGICVLWPGVGEAWGFLGKSIVGHRFVLCRTVRRGIQQLMDVYRLHRVQATVDAGNERADRWVNWLGFRYEGDMPGYGIHGETHLRYAIVRRV